MVENQKMNPSEISDFFSSLPLQTTDPGDLSIEQSNPNQNDVMRRMSGRYTIAEMEACLADMRSVQAALDARLESNHLTHYVIHSLSEGNSAGKVGLFWSTSSGWGMLETATHFTTRERMESCLPMSKGGDSEWMLVEEAIDLNRARVASPESISGKLMPELASLEIHLECRWKAAGSPASATEQCLWDIERIRQGTLDPRRTQQEVLAEAVDLLECWIEEGVPATADETAAIRAAKLDPGEKSKQPEIYLEVRQPHGEFTVSVVKAKVQLIAKLTEDKVQQWISNGRDDLVEIAQSGFRGFENLSIEDLVKCACDAGLDRRDKVVAQLLRTIKIGMLEFTTPR